MMHWAGEAVLPGSPVLQVVVALLVGAISGYLVSVAYILQRCCMCVSRKSAGLEKTSTASAPPSRSSRGLVKCLKDSQGFHRDSPPSSRARTTCGGWP